MNTSNLQTEEFRFSQDADSRQETMAIRQTCRSSILNTQVYATNKTKQCM